MGERDAQMSYAAWRFGTWLGGIGSYEVIDAAVRRGVLRPGMTIDECRRALASSGGKKTEEGGSDVLDAANCGGNCPECREETVAKAERRARRTWWAVISPTGDAITISNERRAADLDAEWRDDPRRGVKHRVICVVELRPGERVIESPGGRGKRGRGGRDEV